MLLSSPVAKHAGEGDRPKGGGGGDRRTAFSLDTSRTALAPSTMLRMVPLLRFAGRKALTEIEAAPDCDHLGLQTLQNFGTSGRS